MIYFYIFRGKQSFPLNWSHQKFFITRAVPHQFKSFNKLCPAVQPWHQLIIFSFSRYSRSLLSSFTSFITSQLVLNWPIKTNDRRFVSKWRHWCSIFCSFFTIFNFWNNLTADTILEIVILNTVWIEKVGPDPLKVH